MLSSTVCISNTVGFNPRSGKAIAVDAATVDTKKLNGDAVGRVEHFSLLHGLALTGQKRIGLAHEFGVFGIFDLVRARRRAAFE
jgi:hypothetical protein